VSVPVLNLDSRPVAAISITGPASRLSDAKLREIAKFMTTVVRNVFGNDTPSVQKLAAACA
jgi:DNA-binding IclR family transcriptional regulator